MLSPRAIAMQGLGSGALFVALQGLVPVTVTTTTPGAGGGMFAPRARIASAVDFRRDDEEVMVIILAALHVINSA